MSKKEPSPISREIVRDVLERLGRVGFNVEMDIGPHLTDDEIELFSADRLPAESVVRIEEHFLACEHCQKRVEVTDRVRELMTELKRNESRRLH